MKKEKEKKQWNILSIIVFAAAAAVLILSAYHIFSICTDYRAGTVEYTQLVEGMVEEGTEDDGDGFTIDFEALQAENPDCAAWIRIPGLDISYPVMQGEDNDYYLHHTFSGQELTAASIFMDCHNAADFSDMNTIIYGHNMKTGSMFGKLHWMEKEEYQESVEYFIIYTPEGAYRYDIFSVFNTSDISYTIYHGESEEYAEYVQELKENSLYETGIQVSGQDRTVILSTCTSRGYSYRFIVCGVYAGEYR